jgi:hypothetical protein
LVLDEKIPDVDMSGITRARVAAIFLHFHCTLVILIIHIIFQ